MDGQAATEGKRKRARILSYVLSSCEFERTPAMTSHRFIADDHSTCQTSAGLHQIDLAWQKKYPQFLDNGREPRPLSGRSLLFISAFFVVSWGLSTWQGL